MKKIILYVIIVLIVSAISYMLYSTVSKVKTKQKVNEKLSTLPTLPLVNLDSIAFAHDNMLADKPTIILYFNSECEHCQYEAESIYQNVEQFTSANLLWVSYEDIAMIRQFAETYKLTNYPNIHFTQIALEAVMSSFGSLRIPHIFIYDRDDSLVKEYKGEVKVETLLYWL